MEEETRSRLASLRHIKGKARMMYRSNIRSHTEGQWRKSVAITMKLLPHCCVCEDLDDVLSRRHDRFAKPG